MSFLHSCSFVLTLDADIHVCSVPRVLRLLQPMFAPCKLSCALGTDEITRLTATAGATDELWKGETRTDGVMTLFAPSAEETILASFERAATGRDETVFWLNAIGPLLHLAPRTDKPRWYGRWNTLDGCLYELFQLRISTVTVPGEPREVEVMFPLIGYPLTTSLLQRDRVIDGDVRTAAHNRETMLPLVAAIRGTLGVPAERATWSIDGEFRSDYPEDYKLLKSAMSRLAGA